MEFNYFGVLFTSEGRLEQDRQIGLYVDPSESESALMMHIPSFSRTVQTENQYMKYKSTKQ